ncbi:hypothetical protein AVV44_gp227 [Cronobacter phage S13]|jgi:hypothetical protein|uniref:Uncharacterized protein n=1 Tax=Cronobacter phage LPCS28 TaxID=2924885 RepID=A0AAE9G8I9_9CAUD|nr:hypothetical protein AVV44_gp227 [Cronobacter phage S13]YP_010665794.1 hypothetical protein PQB73_gp230 [Cronobacter phage LPCS28]AIA65011.1 hypothetical protein S13_214 [Cronobacter phage S13]UNY46983.1 hypothetical protein EHEKIMEA_00101 [Cronobacter phage LPCS28]
MLLKMLKRSSFQYAAITNQIGEVRRIATLQAHHNGNKKQISLTVATVHRDLTKVEDYTLGAFSDSQFGTFFYKDGKELIQMQRNGEYLHDFLARIDSKDRAALEYLFMEYAKETYVSSI